MEGVPTKILVRATLNHFETFHSRVILTQSTKGKKLHNTLQNKTDNQNENKT